MAGEAAAEAAVDVPPLAGADSGELQKGLVSGKGADGSTNRKRDWIINKSLIIFIADLMCRCMLHNVYVNMTEHVYTAVP